MMFGSATPSPSQSKLPLSTTLAWGAYGLAEVAARKGQTAEAVRLYTEAVRAEGGYPPTLAARAARLKAEGAQLPAPDDSIKQFMTQLDQAIRGGHKVELSADVFNLFNVAAATDFLSKDIRSSLFAQPTNYVSARVAQLGIRTTF